MMQSQTLSRRSFLAASSAAVALSAAGKHIPVGLEMFSVREQLQKDPLGTVRAVAKMGYEDVEFFSPYYQWTPETAKEMRKLLDDLGIKCLSTHNGPKSFTPEGMPLAIELNSILGSRYIVLASAGRVANLDGWKTVAETLNRGAEGFKSAGIRAGYHNHALEFTPIDGKRPIEVLAANTSQDVMLQLDVGTCVEMKSDPVARIDQNPGRIRSIHAKEWSPETGYKALFGEGIVPWKKVLAAAQKTGGLEFILIEQEGSRFTPFESAEKCLASFKKMHA